MSEMSTILAIYYIMWEIRLIFVIISIVKQPILKLSKRKQLVKLTSHLHANN